jgi:hypothetical protein
MYSTVSTYAQLKHKAHATVQNCCTDITKNLQQFFTPLQTECQVGVNTSSNPWQQLGNQ